MDRLWKVPAGQKNWVRMRRECGKEQLELRGNRGTVWKASIGFLSQI